MEISYVKSVIEGLKSTSSSRLQDTLIKIRNKIAVSDEGIRLFREYNGLESLLPLLRKPNERILDITLSILGNCCLEEDSGIVVSKLNIQGSLVAILKTVGKDSILGRACRVIGNLSLRCINAEGLHNHGAVVALIGVIDNRDKNTSYPTLTMAVRAIRQLWMLPERREEMLAQNAVYCIAMLLTTECELAGIIKSTNMVKENEGLRKSQEELISGILKCLGYFTTHSTAQCAEQIQGDGRGYQCLVALTKLYETPALKCLMNLCYLSSCRPLLGIAGFVECFVRILQKTSEVSWWPEGAARALAQLSGESVNRSRLLHCSGLSLLVTAARASPHAMRALLQYVFDDTAFQILINEGLINLLTDELTSYVSTMEHEHAYTDKQNTAAVLPAETSKPLEKTVKPEASSTKSDTEQIESLFTRRKHNVSLTGNEDELKVVIERDNMIVGFVDADESDASDDSQSDGENQGQDRNKKGVKRCRSNSPKSGKKIKMANKDWSAGVYWEPKSPEWPSTSSQHSSRQAVSPDRVGVNPLSPYSDGNQSGMSPEYRFPLNKRSKWDWSPESGISTGEGSTPSPYWTEYQWSPSSSGGPTSPYSAVDESSDSEISGRYSPVCSEVDGEAESEVRDVTDPSGCAAPSSKAAADLDAAQVTHDLDELIMDDDESVDDDGHLEDSTKIESNSKSGRIACVLVLLFRVSHGACNGYAARDEPVPYHTLELLTGQECLNALLDYVERCKRPLGRAARILARVLSNALCLMSVLKHRLALRLHNMSVNPKHLTTKCQQCKQIVRLSGKLLSQMTILAESSYGIGEISYQLLKGSSSMKQTLSLTLPYIVRTEKPLKKYFIDCKALNLLFSIISDSKENIDDCVPALSKLATSLHIRDPKTLENRFKDQIYISYDPILDNLSMDDIVTFELDDLSTVRANKVFLCQNSEVFSAMLMGCFKESIEKCVRLKKVTKPALEYLFTLLHCGLNNANSDIQTFPFSSKLETNLEVLLLADRFLFETIKVLLRSAILQFQLTPETADRIYVWSLSEGMGILCVESVAYLLTGKMSDTERLFSFKKILELQYKEQWLDDSKALILRPLVNYQHFW